jgi:hypothetical protein
MQKIRSDQALERWYRATGHGRLPAVQGLDAWHRLERRQAFKASHCFQSIQVTGSANSTPAP